jgi:hypothetical protein
MFEFFCIYNERKNENLCLKEIIKNTGKKK